jgi:hypothetical protein
LADFVSWAKSVKWDLPLQLAALVDRDAQPPQSGRWPWGSYETKLLRVMEAVARKWWINYDPTDPTTAKTKDVIVSAIMADHGCTKNQAEAIYTVLRADDLPRGPRG